MASEIIIKNRLKHIRPFSITIICAVILALFLPIQNTRAQNNTQAAANFTLKSQLGENIKLSELRGKIVLLNFWAPRCGICLHQFSLLEKLQQQNRKNDFAVISVDIGGNFKKFTATAKKHGTTFPMLFDSENNVGALYSISTVPASILIDRDGNIRSTVSADDLKNSKKMQQIIQGLLNE